MYYSNVKINTTVYTCMLIYVIAVLMRVKHYKQLYRKIDNYIINYRDLVSYSPSCVQRRNFTIITMQ